MLRTYGPSIILSQEHMPLHQRLYLLSLLQPVVEVLNERFVRKCDSIYTANDVYEHTLLLTRNEETAGRARAWQELNLSRSQVPMVKPS